MKVQASRLPSPAQMICVVVLLCQVGCGFSAMVRIAPHLIQDEPSAKPGLERFVYAADVPSYGDPSLLIQDKPSPRPELEKPIYAVNAQDDLNINRHIVLDDFGVGSAVEATYVAPDKGRVSLNLRDEAAENTVLQVDARYDYLYSNYTVLNTYTAGVGWGTEEYPGGFDFTPGILVTVRVDAAPAGFVVSCNGREIGFLEYRLPVTSVKKIHLFFEDRNGAKQLAELKSLAFYFR